MSLRTLSIAATFCIAASSCHAAVVIGTNANFGGVAITGGTAAVGGSATATIFTVSGIDVDGDATADTFDLSFDVTGSTGGNSAAVSFGTAYDVGGGPLRAKDNDTMSFSFTGVSGTASGGNAIVVDSFEWSQVTIAGYTDGTDAFTITQGGVTSGTIAADNFSAFAALSADPFTLTALGVGPGNNASIQVQNFSFAANVSAGATAVPEPATAVLLCIGSIGLAVTRRRKHGKQPKPQNLLELTA